MTRNIACRMHVGRDRQIAARKPRWAGLMRRALTSWRVAIFHQLRGCDTPLLRGKPRQGLSMCGRRLYIAPRIDLGSSCGGLCSVYRLYAMEQTTLPCLASPGIASHRHASPCLASHRIASHRIASPCLAMHRRAPP